jgi:hypothetical protein
MLERNHAERNSNAFCSSAFMIETGRLVWTMSKITASTATADERGFQQLFALPPRKKQASPII